MISHSSPKSLPFAFLIALCITPGPLTPTLIMASDSLIPWNAPAINGLSSGALQKITSLAQPIDSISLVAYAVFFTICPSNATASILIPVLVEPTLTLEHTNSVSFIACGIDSISIRSALVIPLETMAV